MPEGPISLASGIYTEATDKDSANRWVDGARVRFYKGEPITVPGCVRAGIDTFLGICRKMNQWTSLVGDKFIGLGTHLKLYIYKGGSINDITPYRASGSLTGPFTTINFSRIVTVTHTAHGVITNDFVHFSGASAVGGITIDGQYQATYVDADNYTITHSIAATSGASGGGTVHYDYEINTGSADTLTFAGWGAGTWGTTPGWGVPRTSTSVFITARTWTLDSWGQDLIANPRGGGIYLWQKSGGLSTRAAIISAAPQLSNGIFVAADSRILVSLGSYDGSDLDPMLLAWSSQENYNDWTPTTTNTAGDIRLGDGNEILGMVHSRGQFILSTDTAIYSIYPDSQFVFAIKWLGTPGMIGPNAMVESNGVVYFVGYDDFYYVDGTVNTLPCDVKSKFYNDINLTQAAKIYMELNTGPNQFIVLYCSKNSNEVDRYISYDTLYKVWDMGPWSRTAWLRRGKSAEVPYATDPNGVIFQHESGLDDDGAALAAYIRSGYIPIKGGNRFSFTKKIFPNFKSLTGTAKITLFSKKYPQSTHIVTHGPYTVDSTTEWVSTRMRGGLYSFKVETNGTGSAFQIGTTDLLTQDSGVQ